MLLTKEKKSQIVKDFGGNEKNNRFTEAQIAMLTERINHISSHLDGQKKISTPHVTDEIRRTPQEVAQVFARYQSHQLSPAS